MLNGLAHFDEFNMNLQFVSPKVQYLKGILEDFYKGHLIKFIKPTVNTKLNFLPGLSQDSENQFCDKVLIISKIHKDY